MNLHVRALQHTDVDKLVDYWFDSTPEHLVRMGVDLAKVPERAVFVQMLRAQIDTPLEVKKGFAVIWEVDGEPVGHSNLNPVQYGEQAKMHLHLWKSPNRTKGLGSQFVLRSLPFYFEKFQLKELLCEPYALNPAPNKTLEKIGFTFVKTYTTIPGSINFEQEVNQWKMTRVQYDVLKKECGFRLDKLARIKEE